MPTIRLTHNVEVALTAWVLATGSKEFSGFGLIEREGDIFHVVDVYLMGVGSEGFTEFNHERQFQLVKALDNDPRLKLWFHRHPIGSGNVGDPGNWSGTDNHTATKEPMGVDPKLVQWSVAIVRTPGGWVGRVDLHVPTSKTFHCAVEPRLPSAEVMEEAKQLLTPQLGEYIQVLLAEYEALVPARRSWRDTPGQSTYYSRYEWDGVEEEQTGYFCPDCGIEMVMTESDYATGEMIEIQIFGCSNCGQMYYTHHSDEIPEISFEKPKRKAAPWQRSFWKTWRK